MVVFRPDRYPPYRSIVKCTCDSCQAMDTNLPKKLFTCYPVFTKVPVLVRSECGSDGFYRWIPRLEEINVACVCGHAFKYVPLI